MSKRPILCSDVDEDNDEGEGPMPKIQSSTENIEDQSEMVERNENSLFFNYDSIFENKSKEVPLFSDILKESTKFRSSHRYVLQKMIIEPCITVKKFVVLFIEHLVIVKMKRHPCVVKYIDVSANDIRDFAKTIVRTINNAKCDQEDNQSDNVTHELGMRLVILSEEKTPKEWVSLACDLQNSEIIGENSELSKTERTLFLEIIDKLLENNGSIDLHWVRNAAIKNDNPMTLLKFESFLNKLIDERWFMLNKNEEILEMSPRTLAEMDPYIRNKYGENMKTCELCQNLISRVGYSANCEKCGVSMHFNCFKNATEISNSINIQCMKCNEIIDLNSVKDKIEEALNKTRFSSESPTSSSIENQNETFQNGTESD